MAENCRDFLESLIQNQNYTQASNFIFKNIKIFQNEEYFVVLYILFQIRKEELDMDTADIFTSLGKPDVDTLLLHYTQIKFCLRRFEYQLPNDSCKEALDYLINFSVSPYAIYRIAQFACVNLSFVMERLAKEYESIEQEHFANILRKLDKN